MNIFWAIILGFLFGYSLYLVGASNPKVIISMLRLQDLTLMKIILFAIGFASVLLSLSSLVGLFDISHLSIKSVNLGVVIGGLLFGIGFGTVGTCPGTCVAASASGGAWKAVTAIVGGLFGAFSFSMTYGWLKDLGLFRTMDLGKLTLFRISEEYPSLFHIGFWGIFIVGVLFMVVACIIPQQYQKGT